MPSFITYYQSPIGMMRISGTETYVSEMVFEDAEEKADNSRPGTEQLPALAIQAIEELIQYFHGQRRVFNLCIARKSMYCFTNSTGKK